MGASRFCDGTLTGEVTMSSRPTVSAIDGNALKEWCESEASYSVLNETESADGTWMAGGCSVLALALKKLVPAGDVVGINNQNGDTQHVGLQIGGDVFDAEGAHSIQSWLTDWLDYEMLDPSGHEVVLWKDITLPGPASKADVSLVADALRTTLSSSTVSAMSQKHFETPAFKAWFRNSKVVDEKGKPLVVFHGTNDGGFTIFDKRQIKKGEYGFFFTDDDRMASTYSKSSEDALPEDYTSVEEFIEEDGKNGSSYDVGVKYYAVADKEEQEGSHDHISYYKSIYDLKDDWDIDPNNEELDTGKVYLLQTHGKTVGTFDSANKEDMGKLLELLNKDLRKRPLKTEGGMYSVYLRMENPYEVDAENSSWDEIQLMEEDEDGNKVRGPYVSTRDIVREALDMDCDGAIIRNVYDNGPHGSGGHLADVYVVFDAKQIKSVRNKGSYDDKHEDIRASQRQ